MDKGCFHRFSEKIGERVASQVADEEIIVLPDLQQALDIGLPGDIVVICRFQTYTNTWKNQLHCLFLAMGSTGLRALVDLPEGVKFWAGNNTSISCKCVLFKIQDGTYCRAGGEVEIAPGDTLGYFLQLAEGRWGSKYIKIVGSPILCSLTLSNLSLKLGGQYTGILMGEGTKLEMSGVKVRFLKLIADLNGGGDPACLNII